jgi:beta-galactosidase
VPHSTREAALSNDRTRSPFLRLLNGGWRFRWARNPFDLPRGFERPGYDDAGWDWIPVPSNWQVVGANEGRAYDRPFFSNIKHPFKADPPRVPHDGNPVGLYRTPFEVPADWAGHRVFLHFAGVQSAYYVWVNGEKLGYHEDAFTAGEFDVTALVRPGPNLLAVEVIHHSDGSYLEDQDYWRFAGIFRDVLLIAQPPVRLRDFQVKTVLDEAYRDARLELRVALENRSSSPDAGYEVTLVTPTDQVHHKYCNRPAPGGTRGDARASGRVRSQPVDGRAPSLYTPSPSTATGPASCGRSWPPVSASARSRFAAASSW